MNQNQKIADLSLEQRQPVHAVITEDDGPTAIKLKTVEDEVDEPEQMAPIDIEQINVISKSGGPSIIDNEHYEVSSSSSNK